ncbi:lysophospholipid acyltransferase family protein [Streptomyces axinellae]|uniref:Phospholipid/glycerol acyltransferase domain-containing protein n=1 Tax=Streptomyces axinellae TaxID=552788 RepID=A0ABN3PVM9_9ACTN
MTALAHPWSVHAPCTPRCAAPPTLRARPCDVARRYAALAATLARVALRGAALAAPEVLRAQAHGALAALGIRLEATSARLSVPGTDAGGEHTSTGTHTGARPDAATRTGVGTLIVANHISWIDVLALLAVEPATPLAKREVRWWPVVGALAGRLGTRFIDRENLRQLPSAVAGVAGLLRAGHSVLTFPQATTWCTVAGGRFRRAVFQAAIDAGAPVRPVTLSYRQYGAPSTCAAFLGEETFGASLRRVAGASGLTVHVTPHPALLGRTDRRTLAAAAQRAVHGRELPAHG